MFLKTLKPTQVPGKNIKQLSKQLKSELNLGPRFNSVHSLWGKLQIFAFLKALHDKFRFFRALFLHNTRDTDGRTI